MPKSKIVLFVGFTVSSTEIGVNDYQISARLQTVSITILYLKKLLCHNLFINKSENSEKERMLRNM